MRTRPPKGKVEEVGAKEGQLATMRYVWDFGFLSSWGRVQNPYKEDDEASTNEAGISMQNPSFMGENTA